jgi:signal transduction histidine kinase
MPVIVSRLSDLVRRTESRRASIFVPFLIIAVAFVAVGYRSYQMSVRTEQSLESLAIQYLEYSAAITARRVDAAVQAEIYRASEEWQQIERLSGGAPEYGSLAEWVRQNPWVLSAIYNPDLDPTNAIYHTELTGSKDAEDLQAAEFYTASGSVRYTFSPSRLVQALDPMILSLPVRHVDHEPAREMRDNAVITVVPTERGTGLKTSANGYAFVVPLSAPVEQHAISSFLDTGVPGNWLQSQRVASLALAALAMLTFAFGGALAIRGLGKEAETTQLRSALVANVSHELRTPLSMIRLAAETLKRGKDRLTPEQREDLEESILRESLHLSHLVENVLDVARLQKGAKRMVLAPVDPEELVREVIQSYRAWIASKGFEVVLEMNDPVGEQYWDRESVSRAIVNLIDNAIKYSGERKRLRVALRSLPSGIGIEVSDEGIGIPQDDVQKIFDPYYRAQFTDTETRRGAGLGLTLVQQIVQAHGGRVEVESRPGEGSTFRLIFPRQSWVDGDGLTKPARSRAMV